MKKLCIFLALRIGDVVLSPLTFAGGAWLAIVRRYGVCKLPLTRSLLAWIGVFPIRDHYYEPMFNFSSKSAADGKVRTLPGLDLNLSEQIDFINKFHYQDELRKFPMEATTKREFYYNNRSFEAGDAEFLYSLIRLVKPRRIIEIGCGSSTLMIRNALNQNEEDNSNTRCLHTCVEPYENPWLKDLNVNLIRSRLEDLPLSDFESLAENDILFIDSSHIIRPGGEVLYEYLEILPRLKPGVFVHIHDIFTPFDYPDQWTRQEVRFWNEQYLLEAFLCGNHHFAIIGALFYLSQQLPEKVSEKFPILASVIKTKKPGSFWIQRKP